MRRVRLKTAGLLLLVLLLGSGAWSDAAAQRRPLKGVVWNEPEDPELAELQLWQMREYGIEAVRTGIIRNRRLFSLADSVGIRLFQELPIAHLPAQRLADTLAYARALLERVLVRSRGHRSARYFGLARASDTSDPRARAYLSALTRLVREKGEEGSLTYYATPFLESDTSAQQVDFVLLDVLDAPDPVASLRRWQASHRTPAGIGALGTWVWSRAPGGHRVPHSSESQARYLETQLNEFFGGMDAPPLVVFVYRWQDAPSIQARRAEALDSPSNRLYGLFARDAAERPAGEVLKGVYTGRQTVFAFAPGRRQGEDPSGLVLLAWGVFGLLAVLYASSPRFRHVVPRYFFAHGFYRESVRGMRDIISGTNAVFMTVMALSAGIIGSIIVYTLHASDPFSLLVEWLPEEGQTVLLSLLSRPWLLVLLIGAFYTLAALAWAISLSLIAGRRRRMSVGQALMLVLWPRWTLLPLLLAALVIRTLPAPQLTRGSLILLAAWIVLTGFAVLRALADYAAMTRLPFWRLVPGALTSPLVFLMLVLAVTALAAGPEAAFLWHLIARG